MNDNELKKKCREMVDTWDMNTLINYAVDGLFYYYKNNPVELWFLCNEEKENNDK